jgi:SAM-dependent methyltransferase
VSTATVPAYDTAQSAFHQAFQSDLYRILDGLPLPVGGHALDVPCGNGFSDEYLHRTRERLAELDEPVAADVRTGDAYSLPFADRTFDLVWSAQSLISLDPAAAVREMSRVVAADGTVAVLEGDEFHHLLLPWPVELEAALPAAVLAGSRAKYGDGAKLSPARRLRAILKDTGFRTVRRHTYTADRAAPFDPHAAAFLREHLAHLRELAYPNLSPSLQTQFDAATDPDDERSLFRRPDAEFTCLNAVFLATNRVRAK